MAGMLRLWHIYLAMKKMAISLELIWSFLNKTEHAAELMTKVTTQIICS